MPPNSVWISLDSDPADYTASLGSDRNTTPSLVVGTLGRSLDCWLSSGITDLTRASRLRLGCLVRDTDFLGVCPKPSAEFSMPIHEKACGLITTEFGLTNNRSPPLQAGCDVAIVSSDEMVDRLVDSGAFLPIGVGIVAIMADHSDSFQAQQVLLVQAVIDAPVNHVPPLWSVTGEIDPLDARLVHCFRRVRTLLEMTGRGACRTEGSDLHAEIRDSIRNTLDALPFAIVRQFSPDIDAVRIHHEAVTGAERTPFRSLESEEKAVSSEPEGLSGPGSTACPGVIVEVTRGPPGESKWRLSQTREPRGLHSPTVWEKSTAAPEPSSGTDGIQRCA